MRRMISGATSLIAAALLVAPLLAAQAQEFSANGLVDLGFVVPSHTKTWLKGGFGKLDNRGWVFDSRPIGLLGEPRVPDTFSPQVGKPLREQPFKEIDGSPGWYAGGSVRQDEVGRLTALYYDNRANPALFSGNDFGWRTKFASIGLETYVGDIVLLAQALAGSTEIDPVPHFR